MICVKNPVDFKLIQARQGLKFFSMTDLNEK